MGVVKLHPFWMWLLLVLLDDSVGPQKSRQQQIYLIFWNNSCDNRALKSAISVFSHNCECRQQAEDDITIAYHLLKRSVFLSGTQPIFSKPLQPADRFPTKLGWTAFLS